DAGSAPAVARRPGRGRRATTSEIDLSAAPVRRCRPTAHHTVPPGRPPWRTTGPGSTGPPQRDLRNRNLRRRRLYGADMEMADALQAVKRRLRGWLHAGTFPRSVAFGIVMVALAPESRARTAVAVFAVTAAL